MKTAILLLFAAGLLCAQEPPRFSSTIQLVLVDVQAVEKGTGRVLDLLGPKDFEVYDDSRRREIREFHYGTTPLDAVFLIYGRSGFGPAKDINAFRNGLRAAAGALDSGDRAAVIRTDSASRADLAMTGDLGKVRHAIIWGGDRPYQKAGGDRLYDAAMAAATLFPRPKDRSRRRAIVAVTPDIERGSRITMDALITQLLEADATLNEVVAVWGVTGRRVGVGGAWGIPSIEREIGGSHSGASLLPAVEATGGEAIPDDELQERFPALVGRIRMRYLLGFYAEPTPHREYHKVEVRLTPDAAGRYPDALIRARQGYYTEPIASARLK